MPGILSPKQLKEISSEAEMAKMDEEAKLKQSRDKVRRDMYEAFIAREVQPQAAERVNTAIRIAAQQGHHQIQIMTFPCSYCNDRGRRINNSDPDWPQSLEGFAKKAHAFYETELKPLGFKLTAQVISFEGDVPGEAAMYLKW